MGQKGGHHRMVTVSPMVWCIEFDIHVHVDDAGTELKAYPNTASLQYTISSHHHW